MLQWWGHCAQASRLRTMPPMQLGAIWGDYSTRRPWEAAQPAKLIAPVVKRIIPTRPQAGSGYQSSVLLHPRAAGALRSMLFLHSPPAPFTHVNRT